MFLVFDIDIEAELLVRSLRWPMRTRSVGSMAMAGANCSGSMSSSPTRMRSIAAMSAMASSRMSTLPIVAFGSVRQAERCPLRRTSPHSVLPRRAGRDPPAVLVSPLSAGLGVRLAAVSYAVAA